MPPLALPGSEIQGAIDTILIRDTERHGWDSSYQAYTPEGKIISAGAYNGEELNWDLRAEEDSWNKWLDKGLGMASLGAAYVSGKLKFKVLHSKNYAIV